MYTCYKYRSKKEKLWRNLEKKYGEPVLDMKDYEALFAETETGGATKPEAEEDTVNLDDETTEETKDEPDL